MAYTIEQNILNQGSLTGRYALKDLSNTGKYSGYVNKLPIRRNVTYSMEGARHVITVGIGSMFTIPNGVTQSDSSEKNCEYTRIAQEESINIQFASDAEGATAKETDRFIYVLYNCVSEKLVIAKGSQDYPAHNPLVNLIETEIPTLNLQYAYFKVTIGEDKCSLPIGYFDSKLRWHTFDATGFVDSVAWVEEDVAGLFPDGRDETYNQRCASISVPALMFTKFSAADAGVMPSNATCFMLRKSGKVIATPAYGVRDALADIADNESAGYYFAIEENYIYRKPDSESTAYETVHNCIKLCDMSVDENNKISSMHNVNTYKPINVEPVQAKIAKLTDDVQELIDALGGIDAADFLNRIKGGVIFGKTEYVMDGEEGSSEIINRSHLQNVLQGYASLTDDVIFSGKVSIPSPDGTNTGSAASVGWVRSEILQNAISKDDGLSGVITGKFNNTSLNVPGISQSSFIELFNRMLPDFGAGSLSLTENVWYYVSVPCWIQWNSTESEQRNALRVGASPTNYYLVSQVAAWGGGDSNASAGLVPLAAGHWVCSYKHSGSSNTPNARIFPFIGLDTPLQLSGKKKSTAYDIDYYQIQQLT